MVDLSVNVAGLKFKNPVFAASGDITHRADEVEMCIRHGVGAVVLKTCTESEKEQVWPRNYFNSWGEEIGEPGSYMGLSPALAFPTPEKEAEIIRKVKPLAEEEGSKIIASISIQEASKYNEWAKLAKIMEEAGADLVEIMMCCPVPLGESYGAAGANENNLREITKAVKKAVSIPVIMKTSESSENFLGKLAKGIAEGGADLWEIQGHYPMPGVDIDNEKAIASTFAGWGRPQRGVGVTTTAVAGEALKKLNSNIPLMSSGGIYNMRTAIERMMVGATLIGMHSEPRYQGYNVFDKVIEGIKVFLERKGYESPKDIIGKVEIPLGIPSDLMEHVVPKEDVLINVDKSKCTGCGNCLKTCVFNAISINHDDIAEINLDKCVRCGSCAVVCPEKAIALRMAK